MIEEDWHPSRDAVALAPEYHQVLFEDEDIRVLLVVLNPGDAEPLHHHRWPSVFVFDKMDRIKDYGADGGEQELMLPPAPIVALFAPQRTHRVENVRTSPLRGVRIEFKRNQLAVETNAILVP